MSTHNYFSLRLKHVKCCVALVVLGTNFISTQGLLSAGDTVKNNVSGQTFYTKRRVKSEAKEHLLRRRSSKIGAAGDLTKFSFFF